MRRKQKRNRNARLTEKRIRVYSKKGRSRPEIEVRTARRDRGANLEVRAYSRERNDVEAGRSFVGLHVNLGQNVGMWLTGNEARTLYRVLDRALNG